MWSSKENECNMNLFKEGGGGGGGGGVTRSYKEKANSNRPIGPYKAVRYLT